MMIIRNYMISAYAKLCIVGRYTLDESEVTDEVKLVPEPYQSYVAEWLVARELNKGGKTA